MKNTANTANVWTFSPDTVTVNGRTFPATYSVARGGDVYVFTTIEGAPIRVHIGQEMPMHAAAVAAAQPKAEKPAEPKPEKPAQPKAEKPAEPKPEKPAQPKAEKPAEPKRSHKSKGIRRPDALAQNKPAQPKAEKPAEPKPEKPTQPKAEKPAEKTWIGSTITGEGWSIVFDEALKRTRVLCEHPTDAQKSAIEDAGFFWSPTMGSWNKKLTVKAHRAALELAAKLNKLAA